MYKDQRIQHGLPVLCCSCSSIGRALVFAARHLALATIAIPIWRGIPPEALTMCRHSTVFVTCLCPWRFYGRFMEYYITGSILFLFYSITSSLRSTQPLLIDGRTVGQGCVLVLVYTACRGEGGLQWRLVVNGLSIWEFSFECVLSKCVPECWLEIHSAVC